VEVEPDPHLPKKPTEDRRWQHKVLSQYKTETRYIARQLIWRLTIEDVPIFVLKPGHPSDLDELIDCLKRPKYPSPELRGIEPPHADDRDVVVGVMGADGIAVLVDQIFTIDSTHLAADGSSAFKQVADNHGLTDEDRAHNFLVARYSISPENLEEIGEDFKLADVPVLSSRLGGPTGRVVRAIFTFRNTNAPIEKKYFVRVDVTEEFPFLVTKISPYYDR